MQKIIIDPESTSLQQRFALIKTPRTTRKRYPEGCVEIVASETAARTGAGRDKNLYPAIVYGPSVSSEGLRIYYLVRWIQPDSRKGRRDGRPKVGLTR
jgi:hypothetical protein